MRSTRKNRGSCQGGRYTAHVKAAGKAEAGQPLLVVEEHTIHAPAGGEVAEVRFRVGDQVSEGEVLILLEEADS